VSLRRYVVTYSQYQDDGLMGLASIYCYIVLFKEGYLLTQSEEAIHFQIEDIALVLGRVV
jgi:hypothetical protein